MKRKCQKGGSDVRVEFLCHLDFKKILSNGKAQVGSVAEFIKVAVLTYKNNLYGSIFPCSNLEELKTDESGLIWFADDGKMYDTEQKEIYPVFLADCCYLFYCG